MPAQGLVFIFYVFLSVIILPVAAINFLIVQSPFLPNLNSFVVTTSSMSPVIPQGSLIYTIKMPNYKNGDVVTFTDSIGKVTHRIKETISISGVTYYKMQGDANHASDSELIPITNIYGKAAAVIPFIGTGILMLRRLAT